MVLRYGRVFIVVILRRVPKNEESELSPKSGKGGLELRCDTCGANYWRLCSPQKLAAVTHCCSYICSNRNSAKKKLAEETCLRIFGTKNAMSSPLIKEKCKTYMLATYGVEWGTQLPQLAVRRGAPEVVAKQIATKNERGTNRISLAERQFFDRLEASSGLVIERQTSLENWPIDGFNRDTQCYIQFDGVHWHGLDLTSEQLSGFGDKRHERSILIKRRNDAAQNAFIREQGLKLIRVSDRAFKRNSDVVVMLVIDVMRHMSTGIILVGREYHEHDEDHVAGQHYRLL